MERLNGRLNSILEAFDSRHYTLAEAKAAILDEVSKILETSKVNKEYKSYWYYFPGTAKPQKLQYYQIPKPPYKRFDSYEECEKYINDLNNE